MKTKLLIIALLSLLAGCETLKEIATNPTVLDGVRELVQIATDKISEKNPIYADTLDKLNQSLADYKGESIKSFELASLVYESVGDNDALRAEIEAEFKNVIGHVTERGTEVTPRSILIGAADLL